MPRGASKLLQRLLGFIGIPSNELLGIPAALLGAHFSFKEILQKNYREMFYEITRRSFQLQGSPHDNKET